jgi:hypothetical protein
MGTLGKRLSCIFVIATVAACAPAPKVTPPPPPAPKKVVAPPPMPTKPYTPGGAAADFKMPAKDLNGVWQTPNHGLSPDETLWNFRSALNVSALVCKGVTWDVIPVNYNKMLVTHKKRLATTNKAVDAEYKKRFPGQNALRVRDTQSTALYNYFALPAVRGNFCALAANKSAEVLTIPSKGLTDYSVGALAEIDKVFLDFYDSYAVYQAEYADYQAKLADWNFKYGQKPAVVTTPTTPKS